MQKFVDFIIKRRWFIAILIPLITFGLASQLKYLEFEGSYRIWFDENSPTLKSYDNFRAVFGNDDGVTISFKDENGIFNAKALGVIDRITQELWRTKYITRVDSLSNYQYVHADPEYPDDVLVEDFIYDYDNLSAPELEKLKDIALGEDLIVGRIISKDAKATMIVGRLTPKAAEDPALNLELKGLVEAILEKEKLSGYSFHMGGGPIINAAFIELAQHDISVFTPVVLLIVMLLLIVIFRKFTPVSISLIVVIFTFLIVLSVQVMAGYKLNNFTGNMPVFVVAIGIADAMHLFWIYTIGRKKGMDNSEAIHYSVSKNFLAILFTSLTTAVGFASLSISDVIPVKTLGIATANAALLAFVLTILFVPALLAIINPRMKEEHVDKKSKSSQFASSYATFIIAHDKLILGLTTILFMITAYGITQVRVDSNTVRYFTPDVPFREGVNFVQENLGGPMSYEIVVDSNEADGIKKPAFMKSVERFKNEFQEKYPDIKHVSSLVDVVKSFNEVLDSSKTVPEDQNLIAQYLLLYSLSLPQGMEMNDKMDVNEQLLRVSCSVNMVDTSKDLEMIQWAEDWWKSTPYGASIEGQTVLFAHMQHDVTDTLVQSISIAIVAVSIMMFLIFKNLKLLPLIIAPNIIPIALVIGVMGWIGIDIDIGVAVSGAIIIGVAVDDTIHFLVKFFEAKKRGDNIHDALTYVMQYAGTAIIFTTIILSAAFLIFIFSQFNPNYHFGIVTASALIIAVIADLLMLPAIFSLLDKRDNQPRI